MLNIVAGSLMWDQRNAPPPPFNYKRAKKLMKYALIAVTATSVISLHIMSLPDADERAAILCVDEYFGGGLVDGSVADQLLKSTAGLYNISNTYAAPGEDERSEQVRQEARGKVKKYFGKHADEIDYCFRQHMGEQTKGRTNK